MMPNLSAKNRAKSPLARIGCVVVSQARVALRQQVRTFGVNLGCAQATVLAWIHSRIAGSPSAKYQQLISGKH